MASQNKNKHKGSHGGQLVKLSKGKHKFEVITHKGAVLKYRENKLGFSNVLMVDQIFTNSARGDIANASDLHDAFNTEDLTKCLEEIIKNGELQYSPQERKAFVDAKTNEIVYLINKNYVDPKTKLPHPSDRISHCMKEIKFRVDPNLDTKRQAEAAVQKMRGKLMFAKAVALHANLTIKHAHVGQCTNIIHKLANVIHEEWTGTGCIFTVELSKADLNSLTVALMKPTNGDYDIQFIEDDAYAVNDGDKGKKKDKKKKDKKKKEKKKKGSEHQPKDDNIGGHQDKKNKKDKKKKKKKDKSGGQ